MTFFFSSTKLWCRQNITKFQVSSLILIHDEIWILFWGFRNWIFLESSSLCKLCEEQKLFCVTKSIKTVSVWWQISVWWLWNRHLYRNFPFAQSFQQRLFTLIGLLFSLSSSSHIFVSFATLFFVVAFWISHEFFYLLSAAKFLAIVEESLCSFYTAIDLIPWLEIPLKYHFFNYHSNRKLHLSINSRLRYRDTKSGTRDGNPIATLPFIWRAYRIRGCDKNTPWVVDWCWNEHISPFFKPIIQLSIR